MAPPRVPGARAALALSGWALALALALSLAASAHAATVYVSSYPQLVAAVDQANINAKACVVAEGCLGEEVSAVLLQDIGLEETLPGLQSNAFLSVTGACTGRMQQRCIIDGALKYKMFTVNGTEGGPFLPPSKLVLSRLVLQRANQGAIANTFTRVTATLVTFRYNINGAVKSVGFQGGSPLHTYIGCRFIANTGTAIWMGSPKFGLGVGEGVGLVVRRSLFWGNQGWPSETGLLDGGAVLLAGRGSAVFEDTVFENNTAVGTGGAVYADETTVSFRSVVFKTNSAGAGGGALAGTCGVYNNLTLSLCSSAFDGNAGGNNEAASSLLLSSPGINQVFVHFCDTPRPEGSVIAETSPGSITTGTGSSCAAAYC